MSFIAVTKDSRCKFHRRGSHLACGGRLCGLSFGGLWRKLCLAYASADNGCAIFRNLPWWEYYCGLQILLICPVKTCPTYSWVGGQWRVVTASFLRASSCRTSPLCLCYFWGFYQAVICVCLLGASSLQAFVTLGCFYFSGGVVILSLFCCRLLYFLFGLSFLELCTLGALLNLWHVKLFPLNKKHALHSCLVATLEFLLQLMPIIHSKAWGRK
jgi:hypothetical protein